MSVNALRLPNPTAQPQARAQRLFDDLQRRFQSRDLTSHDEVRGAIYEALQVFFRHAAEPTFRQARLLGNQPRRREDFFGPLRKIADDLAVQYREVQALTDATSASFNFQNALLESLQGRLKRASSTLIDLQIAQDKFNQAVQVAGDDFTDRSRLDKDAQLTLAPADVNTLGNVLTLRRTANESVIDLSRVDVRVEPLQDYRFRLYEGQFYGLIGQAAPEGGRFHFEEKKTGQAARESLPADLLRRFQAFFERTVNTGAATVTGADETPRLTGQNVDLSQALVQARSQGSFGGFTEAEWELLAGHIHNASELGILVPGETREFRKSLTPHVALVDVGASPQERKAGRLAMLDGVPDSFWQIEYTRPVEAGISANARDGDALYPERVGFLSQILQQERRDFDTLDLDVRLTIDLGEIVTLNWIDLIPMLFEGIEHLEVLDLQTSQAGAEYEPVPKLRQGQRGNQIARETNETLSARAVNAVMAPSASAFSGRGLWIFAPRRARYIRFDLRQPVPVLMPYHVLALKLSQTVRRRHSRNAVGRRRPSTQVEVTRDVELSYPETIQVTTGATDPAAAAQAKGSQRIEGTTGIDEIAAGNFSRDALHEVARDVRGAIQTTSLVGNLLGSGPARGRTLYGNENIVDQWVETKWDRQRYAIAIRDIGLWQYVFEEQSEMISVPFQSAQPIRDLSLEVDEIIPKQFFEGREITSFIDYYVGLGDGQEWIPIAPVNSRVVRTLEGNRLSSVIHVNSGIPPAERAPGETYADFDHEITKVRFRAILRRPTDIPDAENFTPALKSYRLTWTVRGGFR